MRVHNEGSTGFVVRGRSRHVVSSMQHSTGLNNMNIYIPFSYIGIWLLSYSFFIPHASNVPLERHLKGTITPISKT